jgi:protein-S-isoprenylcysteine O-methyltransferase Ste14
MRHDLLVRVVTTIVLVAWGLFWLYWIAASVGVKAARTVRGRGAGVRVGVFVVVVLLARANVVRRPSTATRDPWLEALGLVLFAAGLAVALWARRVLGLNWGMPMSQKVDPELVTDGPYRRVRHPIYSGILLAVVGTAVAINWSWLIAAGLFGSYFVYSARSEERYMAGRFPDTYPTYQRSTKMLIPFIA